MYITEKYWNHYIGETDDSLTLLEYLKRKQKREISFGEIYADFGLDKLQGNFQNPDVPLAFVDSEGWEMPIYYAIDLLTDLGALLLECRISGNVDLCELSEDDPKEGEEAKICITAAKEEYRLLDQVLMEFAENPLAYDLSEMVPEEEMRKMAAVCRELREELVK